MARGQLGHASLDLTELSKVTFSPGFQHWVFPLVFVGFAILAGMWPFHTWAPTGHVAAPTAGSMLLAGVVMKLGAYGCLRVAMVLFPEGVREWQWAIAALAVIGIIYGAGVALVQRDFKFVIGYSSVSHMGFVLLGLATLTPSAWTARCCKCSRTASSPGCCSAWWAAWFMTARTRAISTISKRMHLGKLLPFAGVTFVLAGVASMGLPGFSGFVAEFQVLMGAWQVFPKLTLISPAWASSSAWPTRLRALQKAFYSDAPPAAASGHDGHPLEPITVPERAGAVLLIAASLVIGLFPGLLMNWIEPCFKSPHVCAVAERRCPMIPVDYLQMLRLAAPETIVTLTVLVVLGADLTVLRGKSIAARFNVGALLSVLGCASLRGWSSRGTAGQRDLLNGMLVVRPAYRFRESRPCWR